MDPSLRRELIEKLADFAESPGAQLSGRLSEPLPDVRMFEYVSEVLSPEVRVRLLFVGWDEAPARLDLVDVVVVSGDLG